MTGPGWFALAAAAFLVTGGPARPEWADRLVAAGRLAPAPSRAVARGSPRRPVLPAVGAVLAVGAVAGAVGPAWGAAAALLAGSAWSGVAGVRRRRRTVAGRRELRAALAAVAAELEAGGRPAAALAAAAEAAPRHAPVFDRAAATAGVGGDVAEVLLTAPATTALAHAWHLAERAGVAPAAVVGRVAADLEAAEEQRRAVDVALAGPRSSAAVLAGLPLLGLALGTTMGAHPLHFLFRTPAGSLVGAAGVALDVAGLVWIARILRRAELP